MKKAILFFLVVSTVQVFSQSSSITVEPHENNVNTSNSTSLFGDLGTDIKVKNISPSSINIKVSREVISATSGTENYFCWQSCYLPSTSVSPHTISFSPGQELPTNFQVHFDNKGILPASASIKYCAFNADNEPDSACTIVNYVITGTSIDENSLSNFSDFHPNPASSYASLNYSVLPSQSAEVVVTDMLGTIVENKIIKNNQGIVRLDVSNTPNGLYFANIYVDGKLDAIKRLLVRK